VSGFNSRVINNQKRTFIPHYASNTTKQGEINKKSDGFDNPFSLYGNSEIPSLSEIKTNSIRNNQGNSTISAVGNNSMFSGLASKQILGGSNFSTIPTLNNN
jgi:hypothetical protein